MDIYHVQTTPITGLYLVAQLDLGPFDIPDPWWLMNIDEPRITRLVEFLGRKCSHTHILNPDGAGQWHRDGIPWGKNQLMGILTKTGRGTEFREFGRIFEGKPWCLYLLTRDIEHRTPSGQEDHERFLVRYRLYEDLY